MKIYDMKPLNLLKDIPPVGIEFAVAIPCFVERGGFMTINCHDHEKCRQMGLPRWESSPQLYYVRKECGGVYSRHFAQDRDFFLRYKNVEEFIAAWKKEWEEHLQKLGYSLSDVKE